jgi:hypothetical protein
VLVLLNDYFKPLRAGTAVQQHMHMPAWRLLAMIDSQNSAKPIGRQRESDYRQHKRVLCDKRRRQHGEKSFQGSSPWRKRTALAGPREA